jgi:hypothetical protein
VVIAQFGEPGPDGPSELLDLGWMARLGQWPCSSSSSRRASSKSLVRCKSRRRSLTR